MAVATTTNKVSLLQNANNVQPDTIRHTFNISTIAAAGTTQATGTAIGNDKPFVLISNNTVANGVVLPTAAYIGQEITVYPQVANLALRVYPPAGGTINGAAVNAALFVTARQTTRFVCVDRAGLTWIAFAQNGVSGTFTANGATAVTVTDASVTADSNIIITLKTVGGTVGTSAPNVRTITPGTGFTVAGIASDTSVYNYRIL
jgi:hypothetical protein